MALPPSAVRVEVLSAKGLSHKGKSAFNAFVTMQLTNGGKKFATATINHSAEPVWDEECHLPVTGMDADLVLTIQHRNKLGLEEFLGMLTIPLRQVSSMSSWAQWMDLEGKGGSKEKRRGSLKTKVNFIYDMKAPASPSKISRVEDQPSPHAGHKLSSKAKSVVKGLSGALHHHGRDKSPSASPRKSFLAVPQGDHAKRKLSVDEVMNDLHLDDSMELEPADSSKVMPRSATCDLSTTSTAGKEDGTEETGSSWSRKGSKMRRRLSMPSINQHGSGAGRGSMTSVSAIDEATESTTATRSGSGSNTPVSGSSPVSHSKHRRINTIAQTWLSRTRSASDTGVVPTEEDLIAQGNFTSLSKQTLLKVATRQHEELAEKNEELANLRGYIDMVLMRVIEHNPELLVNLSSPQHTGREQRDGGSNSYYAQRPLVQASHTSDSGCGSGNTSPERFSQDDARHTRYQRSSSSPVVPSHLRRPSLVSATSSDSREVAFHSSFSGSMTGHGTDGTTAHQRTGSGTSSLLDSGSTSLITSTADRNSHDGSMQHSARYRPTG
ncbi:uncharacterized protein LOC135806363 [Sycon ciliatum]|uniref:uncharacterized protein LOC135806363 n=1 Tax=Sycon ciliatum TaxID=27933 RepID=UPI0031F6BC4D